MLPLLLVVGVFLAIRRHWRAHAGWVLAVGGSFAAILGLKLFFGVFPGLGALIDVRSPSGHTATATATYGGLALLLFGRWTGLFAAIVVAVAIGGSRLALHYHSVPEVLIGALLGIGAIAAFGAASPPALPRRDLIVLFALAAILVGVIHGRHVAVEPTLDHLERSLTT